ncbi:peptidoglycan DD-metalloendopeptidase family protein [Streptomyces sp. NPDC050428]|uniref:peptidoglycan DD-metalloendopeptidase family protein n=1 Tax=Streptomyces sp. NPDC050428 TaxID=3155757 RepID=UPI00342885B6
MGISRWLTAAVAAVVMTPVALGVGAVLLVTTLDEDNGGAGTVAHAAGAGLRTGKGGVPARYAPLIMKAAASCKEDGLPPAILAAQLQQESGFDPSVESEVGAQGIAQFMPTTWPEWATDGNGDGREDPWDPEDAIPAQGEMMCSLLRKAKKHPDWNGSPVEMALAGYNAGFRRVEQYKGVPPRSFARGQTYNYVQIIMANSVKLTGPDAGPSGGKWVLPVEAPAGTPYRQRGSAWSSGYHTGVDFAVPVGTPVRAVGPGTVVTAGPGGSYGNQVIIRHDDGTHSQYAHLSSATATAGDRVQGGARIGLSGATGNVTGPHLHFEIRTGPAYGSDISPLPYLRKQGLTI